MKLSIHFECGFEYNGPVDRKTMNELAKRYFTNFIVRHKEMEWCDVAIYDKPHHDIGASRNLRRYRINIIFARPVCFPANLSELVRTVLFAAILTKNGKGLRYCLNVVVMTGDSVMIIILRRKNEEGTK